MASRETNPTPTRQCEACAYLLIAETTRCAECGQPVAPGDSGRLSAFSYPARRWFWPATWTALVRPGWAMELARWPTKAPAPRLWAFALAWMGVVVVLWPVSVFTGICVIAWFAWPHQGFLDIAGESQKYLQRPQTWLRLWRWEGWNASRWCVLLGACGWIGGRWLLPHATEGQRGGASLALARLLMLAPWVVLAELMFLIGVWVDDPLVIPETATMFHTGEWRWDCWLMRVWLIRGALPSFILGAGLFHYVLELRWRLALPLALAFVPIALQLSVFWSFVYWRVVMT